MLVELVCGCRMQCWMSWEGVKLEGGVAGFEVDEMHSFHRDPGLDYGTSVWGVGYSRLVSHAHQSLQ